VLEVHARLPVCGEEPHLDLGEVTAIEDVPGEDEPARRLPREHGRPVTALARFGDLVDLAADVRLEDDLAHRPVDRVGRDRPPAHRIRREDAECFLDRTVDGHGLADDLDDECVVHDEPPVRDAFSATSLKRASASLQKPSIQSCSVSTPAESSS
jgi:hypothetical protein